MAIGVPLTGKVPRRLKRPTLWKDEHVSSESIQSKTQEDAVVSPPEAHWAQRGWPQSPPERSPAAVFEAVTHTGTYATSGQLTPVRKYRCFFSKITVTPEILSTTVVSALLLKLLFMVIKEL